jgi:hypothetical protein
MNIKQAMIAAISAGLLAGVAAMPAHAGEGDKSGERDKDKSKKGDKASCGGKGGCGGKSGCKGHGGDKKPEEKKPGNGK